MKKVMFFASIFILFFIFGSTSQAQAANHYIRDGANGNGSDWTNALDDLPDTFIRGDSYYIADGTYGSHTFGPTTGDTTQYVTIKKATNADYGNGANWQSEYGDGVAEFVSNTNVWVLKTGNWIFDGATGGGPESWDAGHGIKLFSTDTSSGNKSFYCIDKVDNVKIRHIEMQGTGDQNSGAMEGFYLYPHSKISVTGWELTHCYIHDYNRTCILTRYAEGLILEYNLLARNHSDPTVHGEAWSSEYDNRNIVRYNIFEDNPGSGVIFLKQNGTCSPVSTGWKIYGNVFWQTAEQRRLTNENAMPAAGVFGRGNEDEVKEICSQEAGDVTGLRFINNTIIGIGGGCSDTGGCGTGGAGIGIQDEGYSDNIVRNNLWIDNLDRTYPTGHLGATNVDYNSYFDFRGYDTGVDRAKWFSDQESNGQLLTSSNIIKNVNNRSELYLISKTDNGDSTVGEEYSRDMFGNVRGADGVWDRGAYEFIFDQQTCSKLGDLDCSESVTASDIQLAINVFLGKETNQTRRTKSDVNSDGNINVLDIQRIINVVLGM